MGEDFICGKCKYLGIPLTFETLDACCFHRMEKRNIYKYAKPTPCIFSFAKLESAKVFLPSEYEG